jgi:ketosteroid isomerase-like protein
MHPVLVLAKIFYILVHKYVTNTAKSVYPNNLNQTMKQLLPILLLLSFCGCGSQSDHKRGDVDLEAEEELILKTWEDWPEKVKSANIDTASFYWADDAMLMAQGQPTMKGKDQIKQLMSFMQKMPGFKMTWDEKPTDIQISADGQMAYLFAKNELIRADSAGKEIKVVNQALQIWKKDKDGNWKVAVVVMYPKIAIQSMLN